jgi:hypothetical protein
VTTVEAPPTHPLRLVAPWWHWPLRGSTDPGYPGDPEDRRAVRVSRPVFQKYDTADLVNTFLADPQRRLAWVPSSDEVWSVLRTRTGALPVRRRTGVRKLFLSTHHRHYLVVVSLHCDLPGFPRSGAADVCEAGLVVRRRSVPGGSDGELAQAVRRLTVARGMRIAVEHRLERLDRPAAGSLGARVRSATLEARLSVLRGQEDDAAAEVRSFAPATSDPPDPRVLEGWFPLGADTSGGVSVLPACPGDAPVTPLSGRGRWEATDEVPEQLTEAGFPLHRLTPDPTDPTHDAAGEAIWFAVLPTGSADLDPDGQPRFDDGHSYEIRCFVRRHRAECPRDGRHCGCPVTWSEPSEAYQLASHTDLEGTSLRPATVQLPDLTQLRADAARLGTGAAGLRFRSPPHSELSFTSEDTTATRAAGSRGAGANSDFKVCSFSIPLITIVAFFVFSLFLPIVVLVFQLWFLLALRFCIPPDVEISAELSASLDTVGEADAALTAAFDAGLDQAGLDAAVDDFRVAVQDLEANPAVGQALDKLLGDSRVSTGGAGPTSLAAGLAAARTASGDDRLDDRTFAALARGALATEAATPPSPYAARVERGEVVRP